LGAAIAEGRGCPAHEYDGVALVWFDDETQLGAAVATPDGAAAAAALLEDERWFLDLPRCRLWLSEDHTLVSG
jgi:hypothetical protein